MESNVTLFKIGISFLAGIVSFLSPCVLPLVPGYISLISGVSVDQLKEGVNSRKAVILNSLAFNAGLSIIFVALGTTAGLVGAAILSNPWVRIIGGLVIIAFGLQLIGLLKISALYKDTRFFSNEKPRGMLGSLTLGFAFAAGWTPCIGPILGGIIGLAATSGGWRSGLILSSFYSAGLAVPFLLTGLGINQFLSFYGSFRRHLHKVEVFRSHSDHDWVAGDDEPRNGSRQFVARKCAPKPRIKTEDRRRRSLRPDPRPRATPGRPRMCSLQNSMAVNCDWQICVAG